MAVLQRYRHVLDAELQQRACEYLAIAEQPNDNLLEIVCDEMPPFPERESALLNRLVKKHGDASDKRTWHAGGRELNKDKDQDRYKGFGRRKEMALEESNGTNDANGVNGTNHADGTQDLQPTSQPVSPEVDLLGGDDVMGSLAGLDLSSGQAAPTTEVNASSSTLVSEPLVEVSRENTLKKTLPTVKPVQTKPAQSIEYTHGADKWLQRLTYSPEGILYEDTQLQIGLKTEYHGHLGRLALYFGNKISASFESFTVTVESLTPDALAVTLPQLPPSTVTGQTQIQQIVQVECRHFFTEPPVLRVSYLAGSLQTYTLKLPILITKFIEPVKFASSDFFERWKQIGGAPLEAQGIFPIKLDQQGKVDTGKNQRVIGGSKIGILEGVDSNPVNIVGAGVLHMSTAGKVGCLLRLEPNAQAKVRSL